ncbi:Acyl-CoA dehydrogenase, short-chain specific [Nocardia otitidiscaviarum]|uniref:Acyl-CoA dehydrogenase, short-chain specific n=1 Tax=Nocardia otitidiscaviarum TaxID=1823 RepID=A0A378YUJ9_9NOCA|nr:acyl-CoA dehydrogenase [Nocardia otitidiscaviarum]SUA80197.1 Acyl-CoA dehydrogenase, short-chain specific [Nocardia otitidiscaviarum]
MNPSLIMSARDIEFLLYDWLDVESLTTRDRYGDHSRETFDQVLRLSQDLAARYFAPHNRDSDLHEPTFDGEKVHIIPAVGEALRAFADAGMIGAAMDYEVGGMQLPYSVFTACMSWFHAANVGTTGYALLTVGNANLLATHGSPEQVDRFLRPMLDGSSFGTMALSEPHAGSNLADMTTRAVPQQDGTYRLFGRKMWISGGDHELSDNIVHLVLARIPDAPAGTRGISLFIVPKYLPAADGTPGEHNDVALAGINHKMGWRGTVNTAPVFGDGRYTPGGAAGAVGYLVGEPNRGLAYMFSMMNEARLGVGLAATALGYTGYLKSLDYARTRPQGRPQGVRDGAQVPIVRHPDVRRMLLAQKAYAEGALALQLYCAKLVDDLRTGTDAERAAVLLRILTPVAKSWPSQWCLTANDLAIQVLGGAGYTRDYDVEQHYRDNRLNPIHEGTHGIQSLDLLGRAVTADGGSALTALLDAIATTVTAARDTGDTELTAFADALDLAAGRVATTTATLWQDLHPETALANSAAYLEAVGHVVLAWIWLQQSLVASGGDAFALGKRAAARYFFRWELPRTGPLFDLLVSRDRTTLDLDESWF